MKFQRQYRLTIEDKNGDKVVIEGSAKHPDWMLTLGFNVVRTTLGGANTGRFIIYNLSPHTRAKLFKDRYDTDLKNFRHITLQAGYLLEDTFPVIFSGNIRYAASRKQGVDWITELECFDGGDAIINSQASITRSKGYDLREVIIDVLKTMAGNGVGVGAVGNFKVDSSRGISLSGNAWDIINRLAGSGEAFIDQERANVLQRNEYIVRPGLAAVVSSKTGLLGTPVRYNERIEVPMVFEPNVVVGQKIKLESDEAVYNGEYIVKAVTHSGTISGAVGGQVVTTLGLWKGSALIGVNTQ